MKTQVDWHLQQNIQLQIDKNQYINCQPSFQTVQYLHLGITAVSKIPKCHQYDF